MSRDNAVYQCVQMAHSVLVSNVLIVYQCECRGSTLCTSVHVAHWELVSREYAMYMQRAHCLLVNRDNMVY